MKNIKMLLTDCDGCLTDGGMYYSENGDEFKKFNTRDGVAFEILRNNGIITGIITSENCKLVERRAKKLNIDELYMGVRDKLHVVKELSKKYNIEMNNIAYVGDEINDLDVINIVGISFCPSDAYHKVKENVDIICTTPGGNGVIREIIKHLEIC